MASGMPLLVDALQPNGSEEIVLHPLLAGMQAQLLRRRRQWFVCADKDPLDLYASLVEQAPAALIAAACDTILPACRQLWVASPYHAMLGRDSVRLMPDVAMPWDEADARWLCDTLNGFLAEEGIQLMAVGAALMLSCEKSLDTCPAPFASISGGLMPNRHPDGPDGGRMMRLVAEIQMFLHNKSQPTREGKPTVSGLWLWGASPHPVKGSPRFFAVATRNPFLHAVADGRDARTIISECERFETLLPASGLPDVMLLCGAGHALLLSKALLPRMHRGWWPASPGPESQLLGKLRGIAYAA
ncbi:MAG: threonine synthase [Mariprofundaceae bacterium]|nr:threonine synthase [Mariprofundaceae bacterium]